MFFGIGKKGDKGRMAVAGKRRPPLAQAKPAVRRAPRWGAEAAERPGVPFADPKTPRPLALGRIPKNVFAPVAAIIVVLALGLFGHLSIAMRHHRLGLEVTVLTNDRVRLTDLNRELKADMDKLTVIEDLEAAAIGTLGMVRPSRGQIEIIQ